MRNLIFTILFIASAIVVKAQSNKAIFLHHSTGGAVFEEGNVEQWIQNYNTQNATDYSITEFAYPNSPWGWENYPFDYWKLWVDGSCDNSQDNIQCLDKLCQNYELIIFKHCFPGAGINEDAGNGDITSLEKTLANYKLQYRALLQLFDQYPNNKFMVWTLAPLHRNATTSDQAKRAGQFVDWVKNSWLTEDGKSHPNVFVFDFFNQVAELNANPAHGFQYCLKYDYEGNHDGDDSHPNTSANQTVGPVFAEKVVDVLAANISNIKMRNANSNLNLIINPSGKSIQYQINNSNVNQQFKIEVFSVLGELIYSKDNCANSGTITLDQQSGVYLFRVKVNGLFLSRKIVL